MPTSPIWRGFMANADYVWITGDAFTDMRLLIEGAIVLYEEDAGDIMRLLRGEKNREVRYAVNRSFAGERSPCISRSTGCF